MQVYALQSPLLKVVQVPVFVCLMDVKFLFECVYAFDKIKISEMSKIVCCKKGRQACNYTHENMVKSVSKQMMHYTRN